MNNWIRVFKHNNRIYDNVNRCVSLSMPYGSQGLCVANLPLSFIHRITINIINNGRSFAVADFDCFAFENVLQHANLFQQEPDYKHLAISYQSQSEINGFPYFNWDIKYIIENLQSYYNCFRNDLPKANHFLFVRIAKEYKLLYGV